MPCLSFSANCRERVELGSSGGINTQSLGQQRVCFVISWDKRLMYFLFCFRTSALVSAELPKSIGDSSKLVQTLNNTSWFTSFSVWTQRAGRASVTRLHQLHSHSDEVRAKMATAFTDHCELQSDSSANPWVTSTILWSQLCEHVNPEGNIFW